MAGSFRKDPAAILDYGMDWTAWLAGDTITASSWRVAGPVAVLPAVAVTLMTTPPSQVDGARTKCWLQGGVAGLIYDLTNTISTAAGRTDERTVKIAVRER